MLGFEFVTIVAALIGVVVGRGTAGVTGPAAALACIAGTMLIATIIGARSVDWALALGHTRLPLLPLVGLRLVLVGLVGLSMVSHLRSRSPSFLPMCIKGGLLAVPPVVLVGLVVLPIGDPLLAWFKGLAGFVQTALALVLLLGLGIMFCAGVHLLIAALESTRTQSD